jgi:hypothetical protein
MPAEQQVDPSLMDLVNEIEKANEPQEMPEPKGEGETDPAIAKSGETGTEDDPDGDKGPKQQDDPKKRFRYHTRISGLIDRARTAEAQRDALQAELARLRQPITRKPIEEMDYSERERLTHRQAYRDERVGEVMQRIETLNEDARGSVHDVVIAKMEAATERIPNIDKRLLEIPLTEETVDLLADSDKAPELVFYLSRNRDVAEQLWRMTFTGDGRRPGTATRASMREAAFLLGRLEARFEAAPKTKKATTAPAPGTTLNGRSPPDSGRPLEESAENMSEFAPRLLKALASRR